MRITRKVEKECKVYVEADILGKGIVFPPITMNFQTVTPQKLICELARETYIPDLTCSDTYMSFLKKDGSLVPIIDLYKTFDELGFVDGDKMVIKCHDESKIYEYYK